MPFSPAFLTEIDKEMSALSDLRDRIDERMRALHAVRQPLDFGQVSLPLDMPTVEATNPTVIGGTTFRSKVRQAIRQIGGSGRAPEVANWMERHGFKNDSPTRLSTRVYNDLWRMTQVGMATVSHGVFSLVDGDDAAE